ncbi:6-hydroxymethylpterin diphosphokinase MptE-like protein [Heyndrickxia vini]|uniref:Motility associated factor glycosyltransferase family protein n=1 Tax=Heyndrickxia vini TaxID=1476025 RepID=A0ABX7E4Q7_9BACI|nr:6-hydroxymethylpterin diphosphokinase MptE-like protein [Heyndrickxia vini]QQZ10273.1 motility associated factor glycosyltransferase family protein [Heyndrickxia vini]
MLNVNKQIINNMNKELLVTLESQQEMEGLLKVKAKNGLPTLSIARKDKQLFIHSSYNPEKEGLAISEGLEISDGAPIIFLGLGLGYHLPFIIEKFRPKYYYFIELLPSILNCSLENIELKKPIYNRLVNIFLTNLEKNIDEIITTILGESNVPPKLVILPSYQRIFPKEINQFLTTYQRLVTNKYDQVASDYTFQKLWGLNSMNNFPIILETPNLFLNFDRKLFKGKPAIIVGAGPSLAKEIDNLKRIQVEKSAYIFAVGSAINALIEYGIRPHATIAYDPKKENRRVFEKIKQKNIRDIPLIFGSTIGSDSLIDYPGEKIHFINSQDYLNPFLLSSDEDKDIKVINDGPTVTVVALDILSQLECNPIILVGQNLSFEKNARYAKGIQYKPGSAGVSVGPTKIYHVESVTGEKLLSSKEFILAKNSIENYLEENPKLNVINCTKNGASIKYTSFYPLESLLKDFNIGIVNESILKEEKNNYKKSDSIKKITELYIESESFPKALQSISDILNKMDRYRKCKSIQDLHITFNELDRAIHKVIDLTYYKVLVGPMNRLYYENAVKKIQFVNRNKNSILKANEIINVFEHLVNQWWTTHNELSLSLSKISYI